MLKAQPITKGSKRMIIDSDNQAGYTALELLLVLITIGVLLALLVIFKWAGSS